MSLLSSGTVANIGDQEGPLQGVSETMALMISFQADRQIRSVKQHQYHKPVKEGGKMLIATYILQSYMIGAPRYGIFIGGT